MTKLNPGLPIPIIGVLGCLFFDSHRQTIIPFPFPFLICIGVGLIGLFILFSWGKYKKEVRADADQINFINALKNKGEKIVLDYDLCEFKTNNYQQEIQNNSPEEVRSYDVLFKQNPPVETIDTIQSALIYLHRSGDKTERFISQAFSIEETSLKAEVLQGEIILYVDRFDRSKYIFERQS